MKINKLLFVLVFFGITIQMCSARREMVQFYPGRASLDAKWQWALEQGQRHHPAGEFWVGYFIQQPEENYHSVNSGDSGPTLREQVHGDTLADRHDIAIQFRIKREKNRSHVTEIELLNLDSSFNPDGLPLLWLDSAGVTESITFLEKYFKKTSISDLKEKLVAAIGVHPPLHQAFQFLKSVIDSKNPVKLREEAVFWLALQKTPEAVSVLKRLAQRDASPAIRKKAVFGLYLVKQDAAVEILIDLAQHEKSAKIRREAIFWLGQIAGKKVVDLLEEVAFDDDQIEIQKQAVFALSQMPADESIPRLIKVVKTHPSIKIRKNAIFWLGQSEDDRAVALLCELAQGKMP